MNSYANIAFKNTYSNNFLQNDVQTKNKHQINMLKNQTPITDKFVHETENIVEKQKKGDFFSRNLWSTTAVLAPFSLIIGYEIRLLNKIKKLKKAGNEEKLNKYLKTHRKAFPLAFIAGVMATIGLQHYLKKNSDENFEKTKKYFEEVNKTNAKLSKEIITSNSVVASYSPASGEIKINMAMLNDPLGRIKVKSMIRHELVHAKQFETIARSQDGIKKINYIRANDVVKTVKNNPKAKEDFAKIYNEIQNDKSGKYDNLTMKLADVNANVKDFITAIYILLNKKDATYNDIPIFINAKHYEDVIKKEGLLTNKDEFEKADKYYQAALNYPPQTFGQIFNPFSEYYNNILEKEAYKENPWYTRII